MSTLGFLEVVYNSRLSNVGNTSQLDTRPLMSQRWGGQISRPGVRTLDLSVKTLSSQINKHSPSSPCAYWPHVLLLWQHWPIGALHFDCGPIRELVVTLMINPALITCCVSQPSSIPSITTSHIILVCSHHIQGSLHNLFSVITQHLCYLNIYSFKANQASVKLNLPS